MYRVLLIEDDIWLAELYQTALSVHKDCDVIHASSAAGALEALDSHDDIRLVILDMFLPDHNGIEFLHEIASYDDLNKIPVVVLSSVFQHDFALTASRWKHYGVKQYLYKPTTKPADLVAAVKKLLAQELVS